jgi:Chaperone of endosialidase
MGGGGFLGLGPAPSAPAAPDYTQAAKATAEGNLDAARAATAANRVNQVTPYGNLNYTINGSDPYGNPTWTATTSLSDVGQQLLNNQNNASLGLGSAINSQLGQVQNIMGQGFNPNLPQVGINAGENYQDAYMRRLAPQISQQRELLNNQLANSGIPVGSEAWNRAQQNQGQKENDLLAAATTQGFNTGLNANQQAFGQELTKYNLPLNTLSALRTGAQVQNPTFVNSANQATTAGPDLLGAANSQYNAALGASNAANAAQANLNSGLMGLGSAGIMAMSDIRTKENFEPIGVAANGLTVYKYEYKPEFKDHKLAGRGVHYGFMAQEVEQVYPYAVKTLDDGYKVVDYGLL